MADLEAERLENMRANAQLLASLGLKAQDSKKNAVASTRPSSPERNPSNSPKPQRKKRERLPPAEGARKSARIRDQPAAPVDHNVIEQDDDPSSSSLRPRGPLIRKLEAPMLPEPSDLEDFDPDYRAPLPTRNEHGALVFEEGYEHFTPNLSPKEVFQRGVFGGGFWRETWSNALRKPLHSSDMDAFPSDWWDGLDVERMLTAEDYDIEKNRYGVKAGQSLAEWEAAGWIRHWDPRGWMHWYCSFYTGRRCPDDHRQIKRWLGVCGPTGRFKNSLLKKIAQAGGASAVQDNEVAPVLRQTLLHWAYEITEADWQRVAL